MAQNLANQIGTRVDLSGRYAQWANRKRTIECCSVGGAKRCTCSCNNQLVMDAIYYAASIASTLGLWYTTARGLAGTLWDDGATLFEVHESFGKAWVTPMGWVWVIMVPIYVLMGVLLLSQTVSVVWPTQKMNQNSWAFLILGSKRELVLSRVGPMMIVANLSAIAYILFFCMNTAVGVCISTIFMAITTFCIGYGYVMANAWTAIHLERDSIIEMIAIDGFFSLYMGWLSVATFISVAVCFDNLGWHGFIGGADVKDPSLGGNVWACVVLELIAVVEIANAVTRRDPIWPLCYCWLIAAIGHRHHSVAATGDVFELVFCIINFALFLIVAIVCAAIHISWAVMKRRGVQSELMSHLLDGFS